MKYFTTKALLSALVLLVVFLTGCIQRVYLIENWTPPQSLRVAVLDFEASEATISDPTVSTIQIKNPGKIIGDSLTTALLKSGYFTVIERSRLEKVLEEQNLTMTDIVKKGDYDLFGKILNVDAIIVGNVGSLVTYVRPPKDYESHLMFSSKCIEVSSGKIIWTLEVSEQNGDHNAGKLLKTTMDQVAQELKDKISKRLQPQPQARQM